MQTRLGLALYLFHRNSRCQLAQVQAVGLDVNHREIGDDALQRGGGGAIVPESFTHGSSAQRQRWFATGLKTGSVKACDTFSARDL